MTRVIDLSDPKCRCAPSPIALFPKKVNAYAYYFNYWRWFNIYTQREPTVLVPALVNTLNPALVGALTNHQLEWFIVQPHVGVQFGQPIVGVGVEQRHVALHVAQPLIRVGVSQLHVAIRAAQHMVRVHVGQLFTSSRKNRKIIGSCLAEV